MSMLAMTVAIRIRSRIGEGLSNVTTSLSVLDDGVRFAARSGTAATIWDAMTGVPRETAEVGEPGGAISGDGRLLVTLANHEDGGAHVIVYGLQDGHRVDVGYIGEAALLHGFLPGTHQLLLCRCDSNAGAMLSQIELLDVAAAIDRGDEDDDEDDPDASKFTTALSGWNDYFVDLLVDGDGRRIFAGYNDGAVVIWDVARRKRPVCLQGSLRDMIFDEEDGVPAPAARNTVAAPVAMFDSPEALSMARNGARLMALH